MLAELADLQRSSDYTTDPKRFVLRLEALGLQNRALTAQRRPNGRRHREFATLFARLGQSSRAGQIMDEHTSTMTERDYPAVGARIRADLTLATVATAAGRPDEAIAKLGEGCSLAIGPGLFVITWRCLKWRRRSIVQGRPTRRSPHIRAS